MSLLVLSLKTWFVDVLMQSYKCECFKKVSFILSFSSCSLVQACSGEVLFELVYRRWKWKAPHCDVKSLAWRAYSDRLWLKGVFISSRPVINHSWLLALVVQEVNMCVSWILFLSESCLCAAENKHITAEPQLKHRFNFQAGETWSARSRAADVN